MSSISSLNWDDFSSTDSTIFVAHASYELERSLHVAKALVAAQRPYSGIFIATKKTLLKDQNYAESLRQLKLLLDEKSAVVSAEVICERVDLINLLLSLKRKFANLLSVNCPRFVVDISVFPKDRLWVTIDLISNMFPNCPISLGYTEPDRKSVV